MSRLISLGHNSGIYLVSYESPLHDQTLAATSWLQLRYIPLLCTTKHLPRPYDHNTSIRCSPAQQNTCRDRMVTTPVSTKTPVTPGSVSTALPRRCLIFQSTVRTQENHDIFRENCLSRRPYSDQGIATELSWRFITFLRCS